MKATTTLPRDQTGGDAQFSAQLRRYLQELTAIREANKVTDAEIRQLQASTRRKLGRIRENLRHVETTH